MHDHAHHDHDPGHGHGLVDRKQSTRRLTATLVLTSIYMRAGGASVTLCDQTRDPERYSAL